MASTPNRFTDGTVKTCERRDAMTKADELWEKYSFDFGNGFDVMPKVKFLAAIAEYGELVKAEAVKVCLEVNTDRMPSPSLEGFTVTNSGLGCASVISKMKLP